MDHQQGVVYDTLRSEPIASTGNKKWDAMYRKLIEYRNKHNNCLVPNRYKELPQLGSWVSTQRRHYKLRQEGKESLLSHDRHALLERIGFVWATKDPRHVPWDQRYNELAEFKRVHGHCLVPVGYEHNPQLANWVSTQRQEWKQFTTMKQSRLTTERIAKLNNIHFVWEAQRGGARKRKNTLMKSSQNYLQHAVASDNEQTTCHAIQSKSKARKKDTNDVSETYRSRPWISMYKDYDWVLARGNNPEDVPHLRLWANEQRSEYIKMHQKMSRSHHVGCETSKLSLEQFNLLQSINFNWSLRYSDQSKNRNQSILLPAASTSSSMMISTNQSCLEKRSTHFNSFDNVYDVMLCNNDSSNSHSKIIHGQGMSGRKIESDAAEALFSLCSQKK